MKKLLPILLVFIIGLAGGYVLHDFAFFPKQTAQGTGGDSSEPDESQPDRPTPQFEGPLSPYLYNQVLPDIAPAWFLIHGERMQQSRDNIQEVLNEKPVADMLDDFTASFPQGVTQVVSDVIQDVSEARVFILPPANGNPTPLLFAFAKSGEDPMSATAGIDLASHVIAAFPKTTTDEMQIADFQVQVLRSPIGEYGYLLDKNYLWVANDPQVFERFWGKPPAPPKDDQIPKYEMQLEQYPNTAAAIFMKFGQDIPPVFPLPALFARMLETHKIHDLALFYQFHDETGQISLLAGSEGAPSWVRNWPPVETFPFSTSDPMGLMELAFRWPGTPGSATAETSTEEKKGEENSSKEKNPPKLEAMRQQMKQVARQNPALAAKMKEQMKASAPMERYQRLFFSDIMPKGSTVGLNFFGFFDGDPTLTFAFPNLDTQQPLLDRFIKMEGVKAADVEIEKFPATSYTLSQDSHLNKLGLEHLILLERDGVTYLFDGRNPAASYLNPNRTNPRDISIRDLRNRVRLPAQIQAVIADDFFQFVLNQEIEQIPASMEFKDDLKTLLETLGRHIEPMAISAGTAEQEWFVDTFSPSNTAILVDTVLLGLAMQRFMGY